MHVAVCTRVGQTDVYFKLKLLTQAGVLCISVKTWLVNIPHAYMPSAGWYVKEKLVGNSVSYVWNGSMNKAEVCCATKFLHLHDKAAKQIHEMFSWQVVYLEISFLILKTNSQTKHAIYIVIVVVLICDIDIDIDEVTLTLLLSNINNNTSMSMNDWQRSSLSSTGGMWKVA